MSEVGGTALPALAALLAAAAAGGSAPSLAAAQPAAAATAFLGWGLGRASRLSRSRPHASASVAMLLVFTAAATLLPISHIMPTLQDYPRASEMVLGLNPFVALASAGGYDIVRSPLLYNSLSLSEHQFQYPRWYLSPLILAAIGLVMGTLPIGADRERSVSVATLLRTKSGGPS